MPKESCKGKQKSSKAAPAQTDDAFDSMLEDFKEQYHVTSGTRANVPTITLTNTNPMSNRTDVVIANPTKKEVAKIWVSKEAIIRSCLLGDTALLKRWGKQGIRVASAGPAICMALSGEPQDLDVLRCLVTYLGADVNQFNEDGMTPLVLATELEHLHVLRFLVEKLGADINQNSGTRENNALWLAASNGKLTVVRCLVKLGADINQRSEGMTPLQAAAYSKEFVVPKWLVKAGADPRAKLGPAAELYAELNKGREKAEEESLDAMSAVSEVPNLTAVEMSESASADSTRIFRPSRTAQAQIAVARGF
jgi:hypothetical protein